jgi:2-iminobutanoate/2-iminopropanoate deaminase
MFPAGSAAENRQEMHHREISAMGSTGARKTIIGAENAESLPISLAVRFGDLVFVSGTVGFGPGGKIVPGGVAAETRQIFANVEEVLASAGCGLADILKVNVVLSDPDDFVAFNAAYAAIFQTAAPARVTTAGRLTIDARIEIDVIAGIGAGG